jgi:hypothetical protein
MLNEMIKIYTVLNYKQMGVKQGVCMCGGTSLLRPESRVAGSFGLSLVDDCLSNRE